MPVAGYTREQLVAGDREAERLWLLGEGAVFTIADADDECVGLANLGIYPTRQLPDTAEVGFSMAPYARNHGYATAALRTLADWGIDALGLSRIVWRAQVGNEASRRVAAKAGFTVRGNRPYGLETARRTPRRLGGVAGADRPPLRVRVPSSAAGSGPGLSPTRTTWR